MPRTAISTARTAVTDNRRVARDMGSSLIMNTNTSKVKIPYDSSLFVGNIISITSWVKRNDLNDNNDSCIYGNLSGSQTPDCEYSFEIGTTTNKLMFISNSGATNSREDTGYIDVGGLNVGQWYHLAMTWDGSNVRFYKDAVLKATTAFAHIPAPQILNDYEIGERIGGASDFFGTINEVKVWGTTLTDDEILQDFLGKDVQTSSLKGSWLMNEGSGTTVADSSGNGNNGTITSAEWTTDAPSGVRTTAPTRTVVI